VQEDRVAVQQKAQSVLHGLHSTHQRVQEAIMQHLLVDDGAGLLAGEFLYPISAESLQLLDHTM
jgi:hypothetical protein